jgi:hypothetical protein
MFVNKERTHGNTVSSFHTSALYRPHVEQPVYKLRTVWSEIARRVPTEKLVLPCYVCTEFVYLKQKNLVAAVFYSGNAVCAHLRPDLTTIFLQSPHQGLPQAQFSVSVNHYLTI